MATDAGSFYPENHLAVHRLLLSICFLFLTACGAGPNSRDVTADAIDSSAYPVVPPRLLVQPFAFTDEVAAVVEGAGCSYTARGTGGDSSVFASSSDAVIRVDGKLQILKLIGEGNYTDSTGEARYENAAYRVDLHTINDSTVEAGVVQHGEMIVEEKETGLRTTISIVGGCGC